MGHALRRAELRSRSLIRGRLVMKTALHIGGGTNLSPASGSTVSLVVQLKGPSSI